MSFVSVESLNKMYDVGVQRIHVLRDLRLDVTAGEMLAIVGASGVGKSTLLHTLGGLDRIDGGVIRIGDHDLASMSDRELCDIGLNRASVDAAATGSWSRDPFSP